MGAYKEFEKQSFISDKMRISYPALKNPKLNDQSGKSKYQFEGLIPKSEMKKGSMWEKLYLHANHIHKLRFGKDLPVSSVFVDADAPNSKGNIPSERNPEYKGCYILRLRSDYRPGLVDQRNIVVQEADIERVFYAGCSVRAQITVYSYDAKTNKGVALGMNHVQKVADGEPLSGRTDPTSVFGVVDTSEDDASNYESAGSDKSEAVNSFFAN